VEKERHDLRENDDLPPGLAKPAVRSPGTDTRGSNSSPSSAKRCYFGCTVWGLRLWISSVAP
jgi:hypothetical protein